MNVATQVKLEDIAKVICAYLLSMQAGYVWWVFWAWFLVPDISMVGYLAGTKVGAITYNLAHHQGIAIATALSGYFMHNQPLLLAGLVMSGHSAADRALGYGLKFSDDFKHTHLGWIGKK